MVMVGIFIAWGNPCRVVAQEDRDEPLKATVMIRENIFESEILPDMTYIMVGDRGKIFRSTDKGEKWEEIASGSREPLFGITFVESRGWVSGASGLVLYSSDGGRSWSNQATGSDKNLFDIDFSDDQNGIAVGDWGAVLVTSDGGASWQDKSMAEDVVLYAVQMADSAIGWIAGEYGGIYKTQDGGNTWRAVYNSGKSFFCLHYNPEEKSLLAAGLDGSIVYSEDMGETFQPAKNDSILSIYGISRAGSTGLAVGDKGIILKSVDNGKTWNTADLENEASRGWISAVSLGSNSKTTGWLAGANGFYLLIKNNEIQWR